MSFLFSFTGGHENEKDAVYRPVCGYDSFFRCFGQRIQSTPYPFQQKYADCNQQRGGPTDQQSQTASNPNRLGGKIRIQTEKRGGSSVHPESSGVWCQNLLPAADQPD